MPVCHLETTSKRKVNKKEMARKAYAELVRNTWGKFKKVGK